MIINLTDEQLNPLDTQSLSDMTKISTGVYEGEFPTYGFNDRPFSRGEGIRLESWAYDNGNYLDYGVHGDQDFPDGTLPSITTTQFTYSTNSKSNYTVENLYVSNAYSVINWTTSRLDFHGRPVGLDSALSFGKGFVSVDSSNWPELDESKQTPFNATVEIQVDGCDTWTIYYINKTGLTLTQMINDPDVVVVGSNATGCSVTLPGDSEPYCSNPVCSGNILSYNVIHFDETGGEGSQNGGGQGAVPEFTTIGIILVLVISLAGMWYIRKKKK